MTRVAVVARSPRLRAGLEAALGAEESLVVLRPPDDARAEPDELSLHALVAPLDPDVVLWVPEGEPMDEGDEPTAWALVMLVDHVDSTNAARALRAGARVVLPVDARDDEILAAVHAAAAGLVALPRELASSLLAASDGNDDARRAHAISPATAPLTPREREVLALLAEGLANKAIAPRLGITEHTVKAHVAAIYDKLHAGNRAEAVVAAARQGLLLL
jgi:DNA-binding NarL/FixJ family response regulator